MLQADGNNPWRLVVDLASITTEEFATAQSALAPHEPVPQPMKPPMLQVPRGPEAKKVIVIDAGHGGIDPGAIGQSGTHEKEVVLDYALELRRQLMANNMYEVLLTRQTDEFIPLRARGEIAVAREAKLFLSLHVNADSSASTSGFSVYTLSEKASDAEAAALAAKENKSDAVAGIKALEKYEDKPLDPAARDLLIDLDRRNRQNESIRFARKFLLEEVSGEFSILSRPWRVANFAVLKAPTVPQVLIELGYISNRREERRLLSESYRRKLCAAIVRSIDRYLASEDQGMKP
jgi:N-acetylmuramoyl-L-alanine amidase